MNTALRTRHTIFLLVFMVASIPLLRPLGIPLSITEEVRAVYDFIDALPEGTVICVNFDVTPAGYGEVGPATNSIMKHALSRNLRIMATAFCDTGPGIFKSAAETAIPPGKEYGVDYVNLGFRAGDEASMAAFAADIHKTFAVDYLGNDVSTLQMMEDVKTINDVGLIVEVFSSTPGAQPWIRQIADPYGVPMTSTCTANNIANLAPFVQSGQLIGLVAGLRGGAEYELLIDQPGFAVAGMDAQSMTVLTILGLVVLGNVLYLTGSKKNGGGAR